MHSYSSLCWSRRSVRLHTGLSCSTGLPRSTSSWKTFYKRVLSTSKKPVAYGRGRHRNYVHAHLVQQTAAVLTSPANMPGRKPILLQAIRTRRWKWYRKACKKPTTTNNKRAIEYMHRRRLTDNRGISILHKTQTKNSYGMCRV